MKFTKNKIIISIAIIAVLALAFWYGGDAPGLKSWSIASQEDGQENPKNQDQLGNSLEEQDQEEEENKETPEDLENEELEEDQDKDLESDKIEDQDQDKKDSEESKEDKDKKDNQIIKDKEKSKDTAKADTGSDKNPTTSKDSGSKDKGKGNSSSKPSKRPSDKNDSGGMVIDPSTGKDKYQTDPVPEGKPTPVEPENSQVTNKKKTATLSVRVDTILKNMDRLDPEKVELVPKNGVIFAKRTVSFNEGESVFDILQREMKNAKIHMEFSFTPMYNSVYIEGINNLYEFDVGELSGWMYKVNNWFPNYGASRYVVKEGDNIEWVYTCNLGADVGGSYSTGGQ